MAKKKPEFEATIYRTDDYIGSGTLELPFTQDEYHDALQKARATDLHTPVTIELTYTQRASLRPYTMGMGDGTFSDTRDLLELNLLARRLDEMDEDALDGFEAMMLLEERKSGPPIPVARLINMTYEAAGCIQAGNIRTNADLGKLLYENDMLPEEVVDQTLALTPTGSFGEEVPVEWLSLLGRQHMESSNGVIAAKGYFECPTDISEVYKRGEMSYFDRLAGTVVLDISSGSFGKKDTAEGKVAKLCLPAHLAKIDGVLEKIGAASLDECRWRCADCVIPAARPWIDQAESIGQIEEFADFLHDWERRELPKRYKALLQAAKCSDLDTALRLGADLDAYEFAADQATPAHYGKAALYEIYGDEAGDALYPYMDCFKYGKDLMAAENAEITDYGIIRHKDFEPVQAPEPDESEAEDLGMEMK
jgi:hypothetical protein